MAGTHRISVARAHALKLHSRYSRERHPIANKIEDLKYESLSDAPRETKSWDRVRDLDLSLQPHETLV